MSRAKTIVVTLTAAEADMLQHAAGQMMDDYSLQECKASGITTQQAQAYHRAMDKLRAALGRGKR